MQTVTTEPGVLTPPMIDPRSFHVFEYQGDRLFFDRATGTTCELNPLAFEVLQQIQQGSSAAEATAEVAARYEDLEADELLQVLVELQQRGFFRFTEVAPATEEELEFLWNHKPRRIQMLMAEGCNLGCRYCYQWRNGTNQRHTLMPWRVARSTVDYLVWRSGGRKDLQITFFGGEPLLNYPMVQRVVEYCREIEARSDRRFVFELITNATLLSRDVVEFLVQHRFLLFISLDGWREMHEHNRPAIGGADLYDTIVENARYANEQFRKHGLPRVKVRANLTNQFHDKQRVARFLESLGFSYLGIGPIEPLPHGDPSPAALTEDQMDELHESSTRAMLENLEKLRRGESLSSFQRKQFSDCVEPLSQGGPHGITCGVCRNTTIVDNRGNMYPCHRYAEMNAYRIGDVFTGMDRRLVMDYYLKVNGRATTECHDCWIRDYCRGGCAWLLSDKHGKIHAPTQRECRRRRHSMERGLWLRKELRDSFPDRFSSQPSPDRWDWENVRSVESRGDAAGAAGERASSTSTQQPAGELPIVSAASSPCCSAAEGQDAGGGCGCGNGGSAPPLYQLTPEFAQSNRTSTACSSETSCASDCGAGCSCTSETERIVEFELRM